MAGSDSSRSVSRDKLVEVSPENDAGNRTGVSTSAESEHVVKHRSPRRKNRCMFRDAQGRWWLDFYTPDHRRRRKLIGTKEDAQRALREIRTAVDGGTYADPHRAPTFAAFCETFHARHGQHRDSYDPDSARTRYLRDYFGERKLSAITAAMIEEYRLDRLKNGKGRDKETQVTRATINREVMLLRVMLGRAVRWGILARNVAQRVEDYDEPERRERYLKREEIRALLRATKRSTSRHLRAAVYLALETGLRKGELFNLTWTDVDFERGQLLIRETKTGEPRRVPLSMRAQWLLARLQSACDPLTAVYVFESNAGGRISDVKKAWWAALRRAKIDDFTFHDLRHTFASHFVMKGGNIYALAKILGHANPKMTLDRYAHLSPEFIDEQRKVMDRGTYTPSA